MVATKNRDRNENNGFFCLGLSSLCVAGRSLAYIGVEGGTNSKDSKNSGFYFLVFISFNTLTLIIKEEEVFSQYVLFFKKLSLNTCM